MRIKRNKRVVIAIDLAYPAGQRYLEGLMRYLRSRRIQWDLRIKRCVTECLISDVEKFPEWDIDGVIYAQPQHIPGAKEALSHLLELDIPVVLIDPGDNPAIVKRTKDLSIIRTDPDSIGETATECFLSQGRCRSFGYVPDVLNRSWSQKRGNAFKSALASRDTKCHIFTPIIPRSNDFTELCMWLKSLTKPAGILAAYDDRALSVLEACFATGLSVPRDVSLLSVDDDAMLCENCKPTLSSIRPDQERAGYTAGANLSSLMKDRGQDARIVNLPVKALTHRGSTLPNSYAGNLVQRALAFIRKNCHRPLTPAAIADHLGISRPLLDLRFRELLNTSVGKTIISERLSAVCEELKTSNASITEISERFGYENPSQLMRQFKRELGMTIKTFRLGKFKT